MNVISVMDVGKKYRVYHDKGATLKEKILFRNRNRYEERWVLKEITFDIEKGCAVGLVGENGSGKSTLLKLLTRITYPNQGDIKIQGKVSSLLELGAGFHPDMTGRENIYTNASIFGLSRGEIDARLDHIIAFSELEDYIDNPVRTYSSGMYMRLAFSVAINVEADIILIDEILAVGDVNFQRKCYNRLQNLKREGVTIVLVSHDLDSVEKLCDKALWIRDGYLVEYGDTNIVCRKYLQYMMEKDEKKALEAQTSILDGEDYGKSQKPQEPNEAWDNATEQEGLEKQPAHNEEQLRLRTPEMGEGSQRWGNGNVKLRNIRLEDEKGQQRRSFSTGDAMMIRIGYHKKRDVKTLGFGIAIYRLDGIQCYGTNTFIDKVDIDLKLLPDEGDILCAIQPMSLVEGTYTLNIAAHDKEGLAYDYRTQVLEFDMYSDIKDVGISRLFHSWEIPKGSGC